MQIKDIKTLVARLGAIVDGWDEQSGAPAVERHIAASLLAELYEAVKFDTALAATEIVKEVAMPAPVEVPNDEVIEEESSEGVSEVIDLSDIFGGSFDDEPEEEVVEEVEQPAEAIEEVQPEEQPAEEVVEEVVEIPAVEEEPIVVEEEVATPIEEPAPIEEEIEETISPEVEAEVAPAVEEEKPESKQTSLFDMEVVRRPRSSSSRRVIMSLYGGSVPESRSEEKAEKTADPKPADPKPAEPKPAELATEQPEQIERPEPTEQANQPEQPEPKPAESPVESATVAPVSVAERIAAAQAETQSQQVLGEVIGAGTTTLAEAVAASQPMAQTVQNDRVNSLRNALGINDRFILIRDLFGGDGEAFERAIDELDAFEDFNECLVYMSAYRWNPNCDGARMLMDLVTRKLL